MRSRKIPMSPEEFRHLPREVGWKYEYSGGCAHIRPRHLVAQLRVLVAPRSLPDTGCDIRPVFPVDTPGLVRAFLDGFRDTVEYCDYSAADFRHSGEDAVATFFAGRRGAFDAASRLATPCDDPAVVAGAALIVRKGDGPFLDMLFIRERWQRAGLATALVGSVLNALHETGAPHLGSAYNVANVPSVAWHHRFGFVERPNFPLARARAQVLRHELSRRGSVGDLTDADRAALEAEAAHWEGVVNSWESAIIRPAADGARRRL